MRTLTDKQLLIFLLIVCGAGIPGLASEEGAVVLDLSTAIAMTLAESQDLGNGRFSLEAAEIQRRLIFQAFFPALSVEYSSGDSIVNNAADTKKTEIKIALLQPVFQGGRVLHSLRRKKLELDQGQQELKSLADEQRLLCYSNYFSYLIQKEKILHQEEIVSIAQDQLRISRTEFELGRIRETDFLETDLEVQGMIQGLETQYQTLKEAAYSLRQLLGLEPDQPFHILERLPVNYSGIEINHPSEELIIMALRSNYQIRQGLLELESKRMDYKSAKAQWLPTLSVEGSMTLSGDGYPVQNANYAIKLNLQFPLPWASVSGSLGITSSSNNNSGTTGELGFRIPQNTEYAVNAKTASLALSNTQERYETLQKNLRFQIRNTLSRYDGMRKSLQMSNKQVALLKRRLEILELEVDLGTTTRLDFITAQNEYIEKVLALLEGTLELLLTERALESLIGLPFNTLTHSRYP